MSSRTSGHARQTLSTPEEFEATDTGFDETFVGHIGPDRDAFIDFYAREVLPHVSAVGARS